MDKKVSFFIALILFLACVGWGALWYVNGGCFGIWTKESAVEQKENAVVADSLTQQDWNIYLNKDLGFSVKYPRTFKIDDLSKDNGRIVSFLDFDGNAKDLSGKLIPEYFPVISIYYWKDINNPTLKGGTWENEKKYTSMEDFLADSDHTYIKVIGKMVVSNIDAFVLSMPGDIGYEAIMFEHNGGYYRVEFPWTQKKLDEKTKEDILSSIQFSS